MLPRTNLLLAGEVDLAELALADVLADLEVRHAPLLTRRHRTREWRPREGGEVASRRRPEGGHWGGRNLKWGAGSGLVACSRAVGFFFFLRGSTVLFGRILKINSYLKFI